MGPTEPRYHAFPLENLPRYRSPFGYPQGYETLASRQHPACRLPETDDRGDVRWKQGDGLQIQVAGRDVLRLTKGG